MAHLAAGCETRANKGTVTSSTFTTVQVQNLQQLLNKSHFVQALFPLRTVGSQEVEIEFHPIGKIAGQRVAFFVQITRAVTQSRQTAICSIDLCPDCDLRRGERPAIFVHYSPSEQGGGLTRVNGLSVEVAARQLCVESPGECGSPPARLAGEFFPEVGPSVKVIGPQTGMEWVLSHLELANEQRVLVGFRFDDEFRIASRDTSDEDGMRGNGLILSMVVTAPEVQAAIGASPEIAWMQPLSDGLVLVCFRNTSPQLHLLELREEEQALDFDLTDAADQPRMVPMLRGRFVAPFVSDEVVRNESGSVTVNLAPFPAVKILTQSDEVLVFNADSTAPAFLRASLNPAGQGDVRRTVDAAAIESLVRRRPPYEMTQSWYIPGSNEIAIIEETSDTILAYDPDSGGIRVLINSFNLTSGRRNLSGTPDPIQGEVPAPLLRSAANDLRVQRLLYDAGRRELLAASYETGEVDILLRQDAFRLVTGQAATDLVYMEGLATPGAGTSVRALDQRSSSLLEIGLDFITRPNQLE